MPFTSEKQRAFLHSVHPEIAKKWEAHTPKGKKLPKYKHGNKTSSPDLIRNLGKK